MAEYKENCIFIKDSVLEPYYIKVKLNIFEIYRQTPGKIDEFNGNYNSFKDVLQKISRLLMHKGQETLTLKEYIINYEKILNNLLKNIPEIK
jgi:hypothetical protein